MIGKGRLNRGNLVGMGEMNGMQLEDGKKKETAKEERRERLRKEIAGGWDDLKRDGMK